MTWVGNRRCTPIDADERHRTSACSCVHRRFQTTALVPCPVAHGQDARATEARRTPAGVMVVPLLLGGSLRSPRVISFRPLRRKSLSPSRRFAPEIYLNS